MPLIVRAYLKTSLLYLAISLGLGMMLVVRLAVGFPAFLQVFTPVYFHLFMVGWVTQLIFGVSWWLFLQHAGPKNPRGREWITWLVYGMLNTGLLLRAIAEPLIILDPGRIWSLLLALSSLLQVGAGWTYAIQIWPRIKAPKKPRLHPIISNPQFPTSSNP